MFPFIYFGLTKQKIDIKDGITKLVFHYELTANPNNDYNLYGLILHELGPHWCAYRNIDNVVEYFDPFGLIMPNEARDYFSTAKKPIVYSIDEIQNRNTVLCGYWCLYYLLERQKGKSILDVIHNPHFDNDNSDFIKEYFLLRER